MPKKAAALTSPNFENLFDLYTEASNLQIGATLVQEGKPVGFYMRKT